MTKFLMTTALALSFGTLARRAVESCAVLLKNDGGALPLSSEAKKIAVIGQLAASQRDTLGPWVFSYDASETVTILDGIRARAGDGVEVTYEAGVGIPERTYPSMFDAMDSVVEHTADDHDDDAGCRRQEVLHREPHHLAEIAQAGFTGIGLPVGIGHKADCGIQRQIDRQSGQML